jgi:hypothetical protein
MGRNSNRNRARVLLLSITFFVCGALASTLMDHRRTAKRVAAAEPFATFHVLDRQLSILGKQSAALQKAIRSPQVANAKAERAWRSAAGHMGETVGAIERLALRLRRRYRAKPFGARLFGRLRARAASVQSALKVVRSADSPAGASPAALEVDKRIVALGLQYNAITGGYAALQCAPGEWTCCEPKRQSGAARADACRWTCTKQATRCRGFVGARAARRR